MSEAKMTSMQRVLTTLGHKEPDRVPLFLLLTMHGAKELGLSIKEYFSRADYVAEGQLRLREKYGHDCLYSFFYAPVEVEAWGGEVIYQDDGPANSGVPFISDHTSIANLKVPDVKGTPCLAKVLETTKLLKKAAGDDVPIIGVVMSPFSLPVMQMGFAAYLEMLYREPQLFTRLMEVNEAFCIDWSNAQLEAGATAICYFDPVSSPTIVPRELYLKTGFQVAKRTIEQIKGPTATHMASGRALPIAADLAETGTAVLGTGTLDDLAELKQVCRGKLTILGNLNGLEMVHWNREETRAQVKAAIAAAGQGGGFILSDNHGEIPWQVPDNVLLAISEAVRTLGQYPLNGQAESDE